MQNDIWHYTYSCDVNHLNDIVGFGRYSNADYLTFLSVLSAAQKSLTQQNKVFLIKTIY